MPTSNPPTKKLICHQMADGSCVITVPVRNARPEEDTVEKYLDAIRDKDPINDAVETTYIERSDLPTRGSFRNAWRVKDGNVRMDMPEARKIKTDQIRKQRLSRLAALDLEYMRADESSNTAEKQRIIKLKQALRDLPVTIQSSIGSIENAEELDRWQPKWPGEE